MLPSAVIFVTISVTLTLFYLLLPPLARLIIMSCSKTRVLIMIIVSEIYHCLYLIADNATLLTTPYSANGLDIAARNLQRCIQIEEISR